jgi:hypothetical protein
MDCTPAVTELLKTVPVVIGSLLAVFGGVLGQYLTHRYTRTREEAKLIREKAEHLIQELYAHRHWLDAKHNAAVFNHSDHTDHSPLERAYAFQSLYFPELRQHIDAIRAVERGLHRGSRLLRNGSRSTKPT